MKTLFIRCLVAVSLFGTLSMATVGCDNISEIDNQLARFADLLGKFNDMLETATQRVAENLRINTTYTQELAIQNNNLYEIGAGNSEAVVEIYKVDGKNKQAESLYKRYTFRVGQIPANHQARLNFNVMFDKVGTYKQVLKVDNQNEVVESNEGNNIVGNVRGKVQSEYFQVSE